MRLEGAIVDLVDLVKVVVVGDVDGKTLVFSGFEMRMVRNMDLDEKVRKERGNHHAFATAQNYFL